MKKTRANPLLYFCGIMLLFIACRANSLAGDELRYSVIDQYGQRRTTSDGGRTWSEGKQAAGQSEAVLQHLAGEKSLLLASYTLSGWIALNSNGIALRLYSLATAKLLYDSSVSGWQPQLACGVYIMQRSAGGQLFYSLLCLTD